MGHNYGGNKSKIFIKIDKFLKCAFFLNRLRRTLHLCGRKKIRRTVQPFCVGDEERECLKSWKRLTNGPNYGNSGARIIRGIETTDCDVDLSFFHG